MLKLCHESAALTRYNRSNMADRVQKSTSFVLEQVVSIMHQLPVHLIFVRDGDGGTNSRACILRKKGKAEGEEEKERIVTNDKRHVTRISGIMDHGRVSRTHFGNKF
ncbi:hypothetical protein WN48_07056 [Eufriesea mexicana]|uniref:Uncharacterized protein n=1 Tax=Eufriesea mexicana TaxID=516756 RepID=A0A310SUA8_9HYME|nr:hypothetical protein WN48_07056 [Eufriesea mexicana]